MHRRCTHLCWRLRPLYTSYGGSLKRSARAVRAQCNYLGVRPY